MKMGDMEWKNARHWIISTGVESMENRSMQYSEDLLDFAESLRDGVILCDIINMLKRDCLQYSKKVNNPVQHEFLCKRNINLFLGACEKTFKIDPKYLFTASDLFNVTNFKAVIKTLSALSDTPEAKTIRRWMPFSVGSRKKKSSSSSEEDPYGTLSEIIEERVPPNYVNTDPKENIYDEVEKTYSSSTYDTLINCNINKVVQSAKKTSKRDHNINEILETEDGYIKNLKTIIESYITPLKSHISSDEKEIIFMNTEKIYMLHLNFHRELANKRIFRSSSTDNEPDTIDVSAFVRYKGEFLIYASYCTRLDEAQKRVLELLKNHAFRNEIEEINKKLNRKFPLQEQLAVPFQRILKYPLLLRELNKNTSDDSEDKKSIQAAFDAMDDVAKYINEYKRDSESVVNMKQILCSLKFDIPIFGRAKEYGRHLKDGELQVQFESTDKKEKRFAFLFEHALLLCKNKGDWNEVKEILDLAKFRIDDAPAVGRGNYSHCLTLKARVPDGHSEGKNCKILAKTQQAKIYWISDIRKCINEVTLSEFAGKLDIHQFALTTFDMNRGESCGICKKLLLGQISQGYLCSNRGCMLMSHKDCLSQCPPCQQQCPSPKPHRLGKSVSQVVKKKVRPARNDRALTLDSGLPANFFNDSENTKRASPNKQKSLNSYSWFAGVLSRDEAASMLEGSPNGSFLIRQSEKGYLVISIHYNNKSSHIKITEESDHVYLTDAKQFPSVESLISYYQSNSLEPSFPTIPSKLYKLIRK